MNKMLPLALCIATPISADVYDHLPLDCRGISPDWTITLSEDGTVFDGPVNADLDIAWLTQTENADWPVALTLIGRGASAIVILEAPVNEAHSIRVLTQRGETPLLLVGTCSAP